MPVSLAAPRQACATHMPTKKCCLWLAARCLCARLEAFTGGSAEPGEARPAQEGWREDPADPRPKSCQPPGRRGGGQSVPSVLPLGDAELGDVSLTQSCGAWCPGGPQDLSTFHSITSSLGDHCSSTTRFNPGSCLRANPSGAPGCAPQTSTSPRKERRTRATTRTLIPTADADRRASISLEPDARSPPDPTDVSICFIAVKSCDLPHPSPLPGLSPWSDPMADLKNDPT